MVACNTYGINFGNKNVKVLHNKLNVLRINRKILQCMKQMLTDSSIVYNERIMQYLLSEQCDILQEYDKFICIMRIIVDISLLTYE